MGRRKVMVMQETGTSELELENSTYLVEKLASECAPLQYIRELTVNGFQAIEKRQESETDLHGEVIWDVDWLWLERYGVFKLQISDNGTGMTGAQMDHFIRKLSSSGREQSLTANFGLGAKITAGVVNPAGLYYKSWVNDSGALVVFHKDVSANKYGLRHLQLPDGTSGRWAELDSAVKCEPIDSCGTAVTLAGKSDADNTVKPEGEPSKWLIYYLNSRFHEIPEGVVLRVREFSNSDPIEWPRDKSAPMGRGGSQLRTIKGMKEHLASIDEIISGEVDLDSAVIHWHILPDKPIKQADIWECRAHTAAIYQGELYEMRTGKSSYGRIRDFGVIFGYDRLVIYAEPNLDKLNFAPNTARSQLLVAGQSLPWDQWAAEFRQMMPKPIKDMMDGIAASTESRDHRDAIRRRLKDIMQLLKVRRYRRDSRGPETTTDTLPGGTVRPSSTTSTGSGGRDGGRGGSRGADPYGAYIKNGGDAAVEIVARSNFPEVRWVNVENGSRTPDDDLEDRAARYIEHENTIYANKNFRVFNDFVDEVGARYGGAPKSEVQDLVQEWFEQQLIEAVVGVQTLKGSPHWDPESLESALSNEALTTAVMPRYNTMRQITRALGARFGAAAGDESQ
jgi:hypothetical protein